MSFGILDMAVGICMAIYTNGANALPLTFLKAL